MRAIVVPSADGEAMFLAEAPRPEPGPRDVLIEVAAAGVNRADLAQRAGAYPPPPGASQILGLEVAGRIAEIGGEVTDWAVGDEVCALLAGGGYAQYAVAHEACVLPVPPGATLAEAAGLPEVAATVWLNLGMIGGLAPGRRVLIHGGGSGVGTHAVQLVRAVGAEAAVTASQGKADRCRELGAQIVIDYRTEDFADVLRRRWPDGADLVLDHIGGPYLARDLKVLGLDGKILLIASIGGRHAEQIDLGALQLKRASVIGSTLRNRATGGTLGKAAIIAQVREHVWPLIAEGTVKPVLDRTFPLAEAEAAHRALAAGEIFGKTVLLA
ncbi:NAD(P)H quinone oxidoreductase, PIG3 family [Segniliparus rotundus DSM 44985]|uniref:NAD(P)H quinone oxidoreductase, PIG3 family n=1 Tax=Segniliparus rotundus (strain ATCC BAA-972 / CDC 1076 / CIP 108378 / DSM 44985 / JCM 13578) TaxID=640132 RepID=D6ZBQ0_SEGRD|nr:NAD(P)H-quinone oxidoreductase [Segniliparus rotundus]ADG96877.1 NAD(P)H quinone oxidoreductase, PIG3 family [Segniliparus rotundus DSM 44985]